MLGVFSSSNGGSHLGLMPRNTLCIRDSHSTPLSTEVLLSYVTWDSCGASGLIPSFNGALRLGFMPNVNLAPRDLCSGAPSTEAYMRDLCPAYLRRFETHAQAFLQLRLTCGTHAQRHSGTSRLMLGRSFNGGLRAGLVPNVTPCVGDLSSTFIPCV